LLRDRLFSASILIASLLGLIWLDHRYPLGGAAGLWLLAPLLVFVIGTASELSRLLLASGRAHDRTAVLLATAFLPLAASVPNVWQACGATYPSDCGVGRSGWIVVGMFAALFWILIRQMSLHDGDRPGWSLDRILTGVFIACYAGLPLSVLVVIRDLGEPGWGLAVLISTIAVTKSADAGAYFAGKAFGRKKLVPRLSPGKTWAGAIGGVVVAVAVSYLCFFQLVPALAGSNSSPPFWGPIAFGIVCAIFGMVGDLAESLVKRETGAKDSGRTLPGLGGVWDVTDSLIGTAAPAWVLLAAGAAGS